MACGGGGSGGNDEADGNPPPPAVATATVIAANDLAMHCMDREFSVFSILPPFNVVNSQVVKRDNDGRPYIADEAEVEVFYDAKVMHEYHGELEENSNPVFPPSGPVEDTCYQCHPGNITQCERGAMKTGGMTFDEIISDHPSPTQKDIFAVQEFAADYLADEQIAFA